jgi:hypothetical protein
MVDPVVVSSDDLASPRSSVSSELRSPVLGNGFSAFHVYNRHFSAVQIVEHPVSSDNFPVHDVRCRDSMVDWIYRFDPPHLRFLQEEQKRVIDVKKHWSPFPCMMKRLRTEASQAGRPLNPVAFST